MTALDEKAQMRKAAFARRKAAHARDMGNAAAVLSSFLAGYRGVDLAGYMPIRTEINPLPAMEEAAAHGRVGVPVILGEGQPLKFSEWSPEGEMKDGPFGAKIPFEDRFFEPEIVIVPLVAFDVKGGRLGYGGGFYDRTLQLLRSQRPTLAVGFAYSDQIAKDLPLETTDQPLDLVITEREIITT
ncbi:MAG: 5-formyltetrahydrofolate cyclo-ligase [Proteobacteria bacterium]|jgi:5-formyltetrahydrofolate cyclo-ligase|nr:5-formyltetrahydrofolate cyclo-ligase [Pseudomonadota bacterium]MDA0851224.1 5-formyltetrahydrofolate cyclo-ligase [Pseudomonadota bacterium]MDA1295191.1 5-formyltetrahydrofolate cyclo-ligase [Pseudomonadota bacterium]